MPVVVTDIKRPDPDLRRLPGGVRGWRTVHEAQGRTGLMHQRLRPIYRGAAISGTAVTCTLPPGDNWDDPCRRRTVPTGDILVAAHHRREPFGLLRATLSRHGVQDAAACAASSSTPAACDISDLEAMGFTGLVRSILAHGTVEGNASAT